MNVHGRCYYHSLDNIGEIQPHFSPGRPGRHFVIELGLCANNGQKLNIVNPLTSLTLILDRRLAFIYM